MVSYTSKLDVTGKSLLKSKTVWGCVVAILPELVSGINELLSTGVLPPNVATTLHIAGPILATLGRIAATKKIN